MNVNLAPVLGVSRNNGGFLDAFERLYGDDSGEIAKLGSTFISAQQETGVGDGQTLPGSWSGYRLH